MKQTIRSLMTALVAVAVIASVSVPYLAVLAPVKVQAQAGVGTQGARYTDLSQNTVNFGTFKIDKGVPSGTGSLTGHVQISLAAADIFAMYATPVALISAPAAGHAINVVKVAFTMTRTSTAFANGGALIIQYDSTTHGGGTQACDSTIASTVVTGAAGTSHTIRNGAVISDSTTTTDAKGLYISNATGAFDTGTGTATVDVWYTIN